MENAFPPSSQRNDSSRNRGTVKTLQSRGPNDLGPLAKGSSSIFFLFLFLIVNWCVSGAVLWWVYDMAMQIGGGHYGRNEALRYVAEMGLITTVLTALVWIQVGMGMGGRRPGPLWNVTWKTAAIQIGYTFIVVLRRQLWTPSQGMSDNSAFLPIVGHVNGRFFSEFLWVAFLVQVIPILALVSGALYHLQARISRKVTPNERFS